MPTTVMNSGTLFDPQIVGTNSDYVAGQWSTFFGLMECYVCVGGATTIVGIPTENIQSANLKK